MFCHQKNPKVIVCYNSQGFEPISSHPSQQTIRATAFGFWHCGSYPKTLSAHNFMLLYSTFGGHPHTPFTLTVFATTSSAYAFYGRLSQSLCTIFCGGSCKIPPKHLLGIFGRSPQDLHRSCKIHLRDLVFCPFWVQNAPERSLRVQNLLLDTLEAFRLQQFRGFWLLLWLWLFGSSWHIDAYWTSRKGCGRERPPGLVNVPIHNWTGGFFQELL